MASTIILVFPHPSGINGIVNLNCQTSCSEVMCVFLYLIIILEFLTHHKEVVHTRSPAQDLWYSLKPHQEILEPIPAQLLTRLVVTLYQQKL